MDEPTLFNLFPKQIFFPKYFKHSALRRTVPGCELLRDKNNYFGTEVSLKLMTPFLKPNKVTSL